MASLTTLIVLLATCFAPCQATWPPLCISVEREINTAFSECPSDFLAKCASQEITYRLEYCFREREWMASVWYPYDLSRRHACYDCSPRGSSCECYTGQRYGYFFVVAGSRCRRLSSMPNIPSKDRQACVIRNDIRRYYERNGQSPLCSHGAVRYDGLPNNEYAEVWASGTRGRCFEAKEAVDDKVLMWAFR